VHKHLSELLGSIEVAPAILEQLALHVPVTTSQTKLLKHAHLVRSASKEVVAPMAEVHELGWHYLLVVFHTSGELHRHFEGLAGSIDVAPAILTQSALHWPVYELQTRLL